MGIISAIMLLAAPVMNQTAPAEAPPIRLVSEEVGGGVRLKVIGASDEIMAASYALEVTGGRGANRSVQRGTARIRPGAPVHLVPLTLGNANAGWSSLLKVSPEDGPPYAPITGTTTARTNRNSPVSGKREYVRLKSGGGR